jgi:hypothetical protein
MLVSPRWLPICLLTSAVLSGPPLRLAAQSVDSSPGSSLDIGWNGIGISFGNSARWTGLRFNWRDRYLERIDGLNLTLWKPGDAVGGEINGIALGFLGPRAGRLRGLSAGLIGVFPEREAIGITIGGLGVVSEGRLTGLNLGLLGLVSEGTVDGINLAGLGIVTEGGTRGLSAAGLGLVSEGTLSGVNFAGLGLVSERAVSGINLAGLGVVSEGRIRGASAALLGIVSEDDIQGLSLAGLGVVSGRAIEGLAVALLKTDTHDLDGVGAAAWNRVRGRQRGITIGLFNQIEELHGVSLGLLNFAGNNHGLARWTPILNLHFD